MARRPQNIIFPEFQPIGLLKNTVKNVVPKAFIDLYKDQYRMNLDLHKNKQKQAVNIIAGFAGKEMAIKFNNILEISKVQTDISRKENSFNCYTCIKSGFELDWDKISNIIFNPKNKDTESYKNDLNRLYNELVMSFSYGAIISSQSYVYEFLYKIDQERAIAFMFGQNGNDGHIHIFQSKIEKAYEAYARGKQLYPVDFESIPMKNVLTKMMPIFENKTVNGIDYSNTSKSQKCDVITKIAVEDVSDLTKLFSVNTKDVNPSVLETYEKTPNFNDEIVEPFSME